MNRETILGMLRAGKVPESLGPQADGMELLKATMLPDRVDMEKRTATVRFYTGEPVQRMDWWTGESYLLSFSTEPGDVDLTRLKTKALKFLDSHRTMSLRDVLGTVEDVRLDSKEADIRFSERPDVTPILLDIKNGVISSVSMGAMVHQVKDITPKPKDKESVPMKHLHVTSWEMMEISGVPVPADPGAGFLSMQLAMQADAAPGGGIVEILVAAFASKGIVLPTKQLWDELREKFADAGAQRPAGMTLMATVDRLVSMKLLEQGDKQ